jgi:hypothetical protein
LCLWRIPRKINALSTRLEEWEAFPGTILIFFVAEKNPERPGRNPEKGLSQLLIAIRYRTNDTLELTGTGKCGPIVVLVSPSFKRREA